MKRIVFILLAVIGLCGIAQAQVGVGYYRSGYGSVQKAQDGSPLSRAGNLYYYHGKSMTEKEMVAFIQKDCEKAYQYYKKHQVIANAGWGLLGTGATLGIVGMALLIAQETMGHAGDPAYIKTGAAFVSIGGLSVITGVSMGIAGHVMKKNAHKVYNQYCETEETANNMELKLTSGNNGLGLALSF